MASFHGRRTVALTLGASNAKDALTWPGEDDNEPMRRATSYRHHRGSSPDLDDYAHGPGGVPEAARTKLAEAGLVPVAAPPTSVRSEARDAYAYYVPASTLMREEELVREIPVTRPKGAAPPPPPPPPRITIDRGPKHLAEDGAQTAETSFKPGPAPPLPPLPPPKKKRPAKPPFFPYGQGNRKPVSSSDFMASYNVNPVMHR
jgi:hypothetical protein